MLRLASNGSSGNALSTIVRTVALVPALFLCGSHFAIAEIPPIDFAEQIEPILRRHCSRCHGESRGEANLRLDRRESVVDAQSDSGETIVVPHQADASLIIRRLSDPNSGDLMPLDGQPLASQEIAVIRTWIDQGAIWADQTGDHQHWAYQSVNRPPVPSDEPGATLSPIDRLLREKLIEKGLDFSPSIDRPQLLRRVHLALVGLPPTPEQLHRFVHDSASDAYERVVDELLQSPHYGERWAVPWLDLARYADSNGFQADQLRDNWAYRDWVIRAFNDDMPFDQFVIDQIAGDLRENATVDQRIATGFHRMTTCNVEAGVHPEANRVNQVIDRVNTTATAFLGTTIECAQCHDHKYDPFTQLDYYRLFAYFNNTPLEVKNTAGVTWDFFGPSMDLPMSESQKRQREQLLAEVNRVRQQRDEVSLNMDTGFQDWLERLRQHGTVTGRNVIPEQIETSGDGSAIGKPPISLFAGDPKFLNLDPKTRRLAEKENLTERELKTLRTAFEKHHPELIQLDGRLTQLNRDLARVTPPTTLVMQELQSPRETFVMIRGDYEKPGERVLPGTPASLATTKARLSPSDQHGDSPKSERHEDRMELALWLTSPENPLLSRVSVNRWWAEIFGIGLVSTPEDFGTQGELPSHPELLDWLAAELMDSGWSMKHIHKLMVMSRAFQQSAAIKPELAEIDPENRLLARGPRFRLSAELVRDNGLAISGLLSEKMFGEPVMPYQPDNFWRSIGRNQPTWKSAQNEDRFRRGLYVVWKRAAPYPSFINFDAPDRGSCTVQRGRSNTPLQALTLLNDPAYAEMSLALADRILSESPSSDDSSRIEFAMQLAIARKPSLREAEILEQLLRSERQLLLDQPAMIQARTERPFEGMILRCADRQELAAWFAVANTLLNLDETICQ